MFKNDPPFRRNFIIGIVIISASKIIGFIFNNSYIFYVGAGIGFVIAAIDCVIYLLRDINRDLNNAIKKDDDLG